jgi:nucleoside-diphosphate-sugar epimerase
MSSIINQVYKFNKETPNKSFKLFLGKPKRDFVYVDDIISANIYAFENFNILKGKYYEVGSGESRIFEDILNILGVKIQYYREIDTPIGYQFYTCSSPDKWMPDWKPKYNLETGIKKYLLYLDYDSKSRSPCRHPLSK